MLPNSDKCPDCQDGVWRDLCRVGWEWGQISKRLRHKTWVHAAEAQRSGLGLDPLLEGLGERWEGCAGAGCLERPGQKVEDKVGSWVVAKAHGARHPGNAYLGFKVGMVWGGI